MKRDWLVPLTGVAFIVFLIAGFIVGGEPPDADEPVQKIVDFYVDEEDSIIIGAALVGIGAVFLVFFTNYLRTVFRDSATSATILVGGAIFAVGAAFDLTILVSLQAAADDIDPTAVQALQALWDNDFVPIALGIVVILVSVGTSILRTAVLPKWLGWVTLVMALIALTPIGFIAFPGTGLLILVLSIWLTVRTRREGAPAATADGPPSG